MPKKFNPKFTRNSYKDLLQYPVPFLPLVDAVSDTLAEK